MIISRLTRVLLIQEKKVEVIVIAEGHAKEKLGDIGRPLNLLFEFENENELCKESLNFFTQVINQLDLIKI